MDKFNGEFFNISSDPESDDTRIVEFLDAVNMYSRFVDLDFKVNMDNYKRYENLMATMNFVKGLIKEDGKKRIITNFDMSSADFKEVQ